MIHFAICDDEPYMLEELSARLSAYLEEARLAACRVHCFPSGRALLDSPENFDVVFLDIQMEAPDGMETARLLRQRDEACLLVFVTVLKDCVFDAFSVEAFDYLLKPLEAASFQRTMDRVLQTLERRKNGRIVLRRGTGCAVLLLSEIVYCEVQGRKLYLHQRDGSVLDVYEKLDAFAQRVDGRFFRCHRSYLVNLDYVRGSRGGEVLLAQGEKIPVSRLRERDLTQALLRYMKERGR